MRSLDEAERLLQRAVKIAPLRAEFLDSLGWVSFKRGDHSRAVELLTKATSLASNEQPDILEHLGDATTASGNMDQAAEAYQRALKALAAAPDRTAELRVRNKLAANSTSSFVGPVGARTGSSTETSRDSGSIPKALIESR